MKKVPTIDDVDTRLTNEQLDLELKKVKFRNKNHQDIFNGISKTAWFRSYARNSDKAKKKIIAKVKKGIKHGKFTYASNQLKEEDRGIVLPKEKKKKKVTKPKIEKTKEGNKKITVKKGKKKISMDAKVPTRKEKEKLKQTLKYAPSGRKYSYTEIHEGTGSKRAIAYREKHGINAKDYEVK